MTAYTLHGGPLDGRTLTMDGAPYQVALPLPDGMWAIYQLVESTYTFSRVRRDQRDGFEEMLAAAKAKTAARLALRDALDVVRAPLAATVIALHTMDEFGDCAGCTDGVPSDQVVAVRWPCRTVMAVVDGLEITTPGLDLLR